LGQGSLAALELGVGEAVADLKIHRENALLVVRYQRLSAMPIDKPPARFVAAEPGMSRKPSRS